LAARPGERLAVAMGLAGGAWAILERVRKTPEEDIVAPRVLGVDDWAIRRGQRYGTILTDLERHLVIDMFADRDAETLAAWLTAHPGVEIISRDRGGAYAEGARQGAPGAIQVADRFHLVKNLMEALERACTRHHAALGRAAEATHPKPLPKEPGRKRRYSGLPHNRPGPIQDEQRSAERRARRFARYDEVVALCRCGMPRNRIAERVGLDRKTVSVWLAAGRFPERAEHARRPHRLDAYAEYLDERYDAGLDTAAQLLRELRERGYRGPYQTVSRYGAEMRRTRPRGAPRGAPWGVPCGLQPRALAWGHAPAPSPRETAWLLRNADAKPAELSAEERAYGEALGRESPALATARRLVREFVAMLEHHDANALEPWLAAAGDSELRAFAAGVRRDHDAVLAALRFPWSNGQVEGPVNRVKLVKRSMDGRAGFALLRKRVLRAA
jgi:transposase